MKANARIHQAPRARRRRGAGLVVALVTLLIVMSTMATIIHSLLVDLRQTRQAAMELQAHWLADSAVGRAIVQLRADPTYEGETWKPWMGMKEDNESVGVTEIRIERTSDNKDLRVIVNARYPDHPWRRVVMRRTFLISPANNNSAAGSSPQETAP
ncbi:MAG: hypothetical protein JF612_00235 [Planctomycetia bacterium]|nr:hypothetical protein [Planctomycetia bacterium]